MIYRQVHEPFANRNLVNVDQALVLRTAHRSEASVLATMSRLHIEHGLNWRWTPARVRRHIRDPESVVLVASLDGVIEGFAIMRFGEKEAHLLLLAVQPQARNTGIGKALVQWLEKSARMAGIVGIRLEVRAKNRTAQRFYESLGYRLAGRVDRYYDSAESAIVMTRAIDNDS